MYSQCPQCRAIFKVSEPDLGAHHGLVRCGRCNAVFHAVTNEVADLQVPLEDDVPDSTVDTLLSFGEHGVSAPDPLRDERPQSTEPDRLSDLQNDDLPDDEWIEPELPKLRSKETPPALDENDPLEGLVTEEILIEAPTVLRNAFDDDMEEEFEEDNVDTAPKSDAQTVARKAGTTDDASEPQRTVKAEHPNVDIARARVRRLADSTPAGESDSESQRRVPRKSSARGKDIKLVELPQPRPFKTASLSLLSVFLVLLLLWQVKTFMLDDLAQVPLLRPYLERICHPLGCSLPPRLSFAQIDLVGTSINVNPEIPGALEIKASLMNRAHFPQPYPLLRVTLTDREGRIVGRRTYLPSEYQQGKKGRLLPIQETSDVSINLAQPTENAVGYEVELVSPDLGND